MKISKKVCLGCKVPFRPKYQPTERDKYIYCSPKCFQKNRPIIKYTCLICKAVYRNSLTHRSYMFCSKKCYSVFRFNKGRVNKSCKFCGNVFNTLKNKKKHIFCSRKCAYSFMVGENSPRYKGGHLSGNGYWNLWDGNNKKHISEHRKVMESFLGRKLERMEVVHHKNHNRLDNRLENLELMTWPDHMRHHYQEREIDKRGRFLPRPKIGANHGVI